MVNPSPEVIGRDFNNLKDDEGEESLISPIRKINNIINLIDNTVKHNLNDEQITYNSLNNSHLFIQQTSTNVLRVFHQNIRGLKNKTNDLLSALGPDFPHVLCLTEHHMNPQERNNITIDYYNLGVVYCRKFFCKGGMYVCAQLHKLCKYQRG
jgi:hypothetical protein